MIFEDQQLSLEVAKAAKEFTEIQSRRYIYTMHFISDISEYI